MYYTIVQYGGLICVYRCRSEDFETNLVKNIRTINTSMNLTAVVGNLCSWPGQSMRNVKCYVQLAN